MRWVPQPKVAAHAATSPCVPQILPGLYLGNFIGKQSPTTTETFSDGELGLLVFAPPCLPTLPDALPHAPTTRSALPLGLCRQRQEWRHQGKRKAETLCLHFGFLI